MERDEPGFVGAIGNTILAPLALRAQLISQGMDVELANWIGIVQMDLLNGIIKLKERPAEGDIFIRIAGNSNTVELPAHDDALLPGWKEFAGALSSVPINRTQDLSLCIRHVQLTSTVTKILLQSFGLAPLQELYLVNNALGSGGIKFVASAIKANKHLMDLSLNGNPIGSNHDARTLVGALKNHPTMKNLSLCACSIGQRIDVTRTIISTFDWMERVFLCDNHIGSQSAALISNCLARNPFIKRLWLCNNLLTDPDAVLIADGLKTNTNLRMLKLSGNAIEETGITALDKAVLNVFSMNELYDSNHTCSIDIGGVCNQFVCPKLNRNIKIESTLLSFYEPEGLHLRLYINSLPIKLMPHVLASLKDERIDEALRKTVLFRIMRGWSMPLLYTSRASVELRRSERIRKNKIAMLLRGK
ncbi:hypothetical protein ACHAWF_004505 [Thalassiosira exigua]